MKRPKRQIGVGDWKVSEQEKRYIAEVLDSGRLTYGPFSQRLERLFADAHGCAYCVLTNSGTSSLQITVAALKERHGWEDSDEILCPATTFIASSNVILQNNLRPVFVDVESDTYNIDPEEIKKQIGPKTRAIMVAHLYGQPASMDPILEIAKRHDLRIIEDSAETMFAAYKGKPVGSFGDISCFSMYSCHLIVSGVGGLTCTNDKGLAIMLRSIANHGRDNIYLKMDDDKGKRGEELKQIISRRFRFVRMGYSYRITELEAALGLAQVENADAMMKARRRNAQRLMAGLERWERFIQLPECRPDRDHSYMMFPILIKEDAPFTREKLTLALEEANIETRPMVSLLDQPYYRELFGKIEDDYPISRWITHNGFYIGCQPQLSDEEIDYMLETLNDFFRLHVRDANHDARGTTRPSR